LLPERAAITLYSELYTTTQRVALYLNAMHDPSGRLANAVHPTIDESVTAKFHYADPTGPGSPREKLRWLVRAGLRQSPCGVVEFSHKSTTYAAPVSAVYGSVRVVQQLFSS